MIAKQEINIPNFRAFEKATLKDGYSSYFSVQKGERVEDVCKNYGFTSEEIDMIKARIFRGNPHWVELETKQEEEKKDLIQEAKAHEANRKEELLKLNKKEQIELLKKLGVDKNDIPHFEKDRVDLIYKMEMS